MHTVSLSTFSQNSDILAPNPTLWETTLGVASSRSLEAASDGSAAWVMGLTEEQEVEELKQMFKSPTKGLRRRPAWDDTPMRARPAALKGLRPVTREPW